MNRILLLVALTMPAAALAKPETKPCSDAEIKKRMDVALAASERYVIALEKATAKWKEDCEVARKDLVALEPEATKFYEAMMAVKAWGQTLDDACRARIQELGEKHPKAQALTKRAPLIEAKVKPMLERCQGDAAFREAAAKGLRVMKKKKAAPTAPPTKP